MSEPKPSIYRENALKHYVQGRDRDVLPRLVSPPAFLLLWILLSFCLLCGLLSWNLRVPVYISGTGIITEVSIQNQASAVIFLPASQLQTLHHGQPVQLTIGSTGLSKQLSVTSVVPILLSPAEASKRYGLTNELTLLVQQPSTAIVVNLGPGLALSLYNGTIVRAQIQIGSQRLLALLPLVGSSIGA